MILSDREIAAALERGAIRITPVPAPVAWSSTAVDLTLDGEISRWKSPAAGDAVVCPGRHDFDYVQIAAAQTERVVLGQEGYDLLPLQFILGWTQEKIQLPHRSRIAARVEGKSSLARLGLGVHVTAPTIHAGFGFSESEPEKIGTRIQLEIFNLGPRPVRLERGMRVCQLIFEEVHGTPQKGYTGRFTDQGPA